MTTMTKDELSSNLVSPITFQKKELHKCPYCENTCFGIQCKQCHIKMLEEQQGICIDCNTSFHAVRKDGSKRRRCISCQTIYNEKYISKCPICSSSYHAYLDDGRFFDKCFSCYKKSFHQCSNCDKSTKIEYDLCKLCYHEEKKNKYNNYSIPTSNIKRFFTKELELFKCEITGCSNISSSRICTQCV